MTTSSAPNPQTEAMLSVVGEGSLQAQAPSVPTEPVADRWADLERLAKAATPGPWTWEDWDLLNPAIREGHKRVIKSEPYEGQLIDPDGPIAAFIPAADPAAILELIAAARATEQADGAVLVRLSVRAAELVDSLCVDRGLDLSDHLGCRAQEGGGGASEDERMLGHYLSEVQSAIKAAARLPLDTRGEG
jgi:hypothetical protein